MGNQQSIGFPSGMLGDHHLKINVVGETEDWIALDKPKDIAIRQHPWNAKAPNIDSALNRQLKTKKPELLKCNATLFGSVFIMEPEISGVALFAKHKTSLAALRNLTGSSKLQFKFLLVTKSNQEDTYDRILADEPLLVHNTKPKMIPSTAKGKKAQTHFKQIYASPSGWRLWEATTPFPRLHQVRAHASVKKIPILGDLSYSGPDIPLLNRSRKDSKQTRQPVFRGIALHLSEVTLPDLKEPDKLIRVSAEPPKNFKLLLKHLKLNHTNLNQSAGS